MQKFKQYEPMIEVKQPLTAHLFVPSTDHAPHRKAHAFVTQHHVTQKLRSSSYRNPMIVPQSVQPEKKIKKYMTVNEQMN